MKKKVVTYSDQINQFLDDAEAIADKVVDGMSEKVRPEFKSAVHARAFHRAMDELTERAGVRKHRADKWDRPLT